MAAADVFKTIKENEVKFVDLRFTDTKGKEQHVTVPVKAFGEDKFKDGHAFDGSSIAGWKGIEASDMLLMPDPDSARMDPFYDEPTLDISCDVLEPSDRQGLRARPALDREEGRGLPQEHRPRRHRLLRPRARVLHLRRGRVEGRHVGQLREDQLRGSAVVLRREDRGRQPRPPPAGEGRLLSRAPGRLAAGHPLGHVPRARGAGRRGRSAPPRGGGARPVRDRHQVQHAGEARRLAADPQVHGAGTWRAPTARPRPSCPSPSWATTARACTCTSRCGRAARTSSPATATRACRISRSTTSAASSSTRRRSTRSPTRAPTRTSAWCPGFEAPINLAYSARNRSASCRIPFVSSPKGRRVEVRFPDPTANPYLALRRAADGGPGRRAEQDPPRRPARQEPLRPRAGRGREGAAPVRLARRGAG